MADRPQAVAIVESADPKKPGFRQAAPEYFYYLMEFLPRIFEQNENILFISRNDINPQHRMVIATGVAFIWNQPDRKLAIRPALKVFLFSRNFFVGKTTNTAEHGLTSESL